MPESAWINVHLDGTGHADWTVHFFLASLPTKSVKSETTPEFDALGAAIQRKSQAVEAANGSRANALFSCALAHVNWHARFCLPSPRNAWIRVRSGFKL